MKIVTVVGARPQFIKAATVSRQLAQKEGVDELIVHTGQHYDTQMSAIFFEELEIPKPAYQLGIGSATHGAQTGRMLEAVEQVLLKERPDWCLVYGDTNSTLAGALAAVKLHIPVAHVEAGLRSFDRRMPEEINRILTDHAADLLFAPTQGAVEQLAREGIAGDQVLFCGDVMFDAARFYAAKAQQQSHIIERLALQSKGYLLATIHRAENTDDPKRLYAIVTGLADVATQVPVVLPLHPRTRAALERVGGLEELLEQVRVIEPVGYLDMIALEQHARLVITDSGGVQKEAFFFGVPCVTLRETTEWRELIQLGWNRLIPPQDGAKVAEGIYAALQAPLGEQAQPYGDGQAAVCIAHRLCSGEDS